MDDHMHLHHPKHRRTHESIALVDVHDTERERGARVSRGEKEE
jgi:hypothetical protein